jgi:hypothetical protein
MRKLAFHPTMAGDRFVCIIILTSELCESKSAAENGIAPVKKNAPDARVDDQT